MRIAFLLNQFPLLSETFVLNQITGLIDRGQHVDIYVRSIIPQPKIHGDVHRYGLRPIDLYQDNLPDSATWDDVMYRIYVRQAIEAGVKDSDQGRTIDVKEVRKRFGLPA